MPDAPLVASDVWLPALAPFLTASAVCILLVPATMALARYFGAVAHPGDRHLHREPTPRLGGIALFGGFAVALLIFGGPVSNRWEVLAVCAAITVAMAVDDILDLPWAMKATIEVGAGLLAAALGITISYFALPGGHSPDIVQLGWLALPITVVFIWGMQVSINFLDGSDGVAAGVVAIVAGVLLLAAINRTEAPSDVQGGVIIMSGALMGCCTGFLVLNLPPAKVFMGDTGSHVLGVAVAVISILGVAKIAVALSLAVPLIALGVPIGDTAFAIVRRRRAGRSIAEPDAGHLHHRLQARGMTPMETALTFYLITAILGCVSLFIFGHRHILDIALGLLVLALLGLWWRNRRRNGRMAVDADGFVLLAGHATVSPRMHREGESD